MGTFPQGIAVPPLPTITTVSLECLGSSMVSMQGNFYMLGSGFFDNTNYPVANLAIFYPFSIAVPCTITKMWSRNGSTVAGNIDVGIYDVSGSRLTSGGGTAMTGTTAFQSYDVTDARIDAGAYYLAVACSSTSTQFLGANAFNKIHGEMLGALEMASAYPLPAQATFAKYAGAGTNFFLPLFGAVVNRTFF